MTGNSPSWSAQQPRRVSRGCSRSQLVAFARPYRVVSAVVTWAGSGQVTGLFSANSGPCLGGRPVAPGGRGGFGRRRTRPERIRPSSSTGWSASTNASRVMS
jgi:hypothetical protein